MMLDQENWHSFWDIANPRQGAKALIEMYGDAATAAAAKCVADALSDERDDDYRFWVAVLARLRAAEQKELELELCSPESPAETPAGA